MKKVKVVNHRDVDVYVRDAFGNVHMLFPKEERTITAITENAPSQSSKDSKEK